VGQTIVFCGLSAKLADDKERSSAPRNCFGQSGITSISSNADTQWPSALIHQVSADESTGPATSIRFIGQRSIDINAAFAASPSEAEFTV
jgi:hypothetical protein